MGQWFSDNWLNLSIAVSGIGGLWFAGYSIRKDAEARKEEAKQRRIANLLTITANHRELWKECLINPALNRVVDPKADLEQQPVTPAEEIFMSMAISHASSTYEALKDDLLTKQDGFCRDVKDYFSLPVPRAVWSSTRQLQNRDFAAFVDSLGK